MNKKYILSLMLVSILIKTSFAQTKILDSNVSWSTNTLSIFLSDSGNISTVELSLGTTLGANDVYHQTWNVGSGVTPVGDQLLASLNGVTPGTYYLDLKLTLASDASVKEMEYMTPAQ